MPPLDNMLTELFLPRNQNALSGKLAFCKQPNVHTDRSGNSIVPLSSILQPTPALQAALNELESTALIRRDHRVVSVHRVVQEAMNYHSQQDLQESFDCAVALVYEAL